jgi:hypothetical protein
MKAKIDHYCEFIADLHQKGLTSPTKILLKLLKYYRAYLSQSGQLFSPPSLDFIKAISPLIEMSVSQAESCQLMATIELELQSFQDGQFDENFHSLWIAFFASYAYLFHPGAVAIPPTPHPSLSLLRKCWLKAKFLQQQRANEDLSVVMTASATATKNARRKVDDAFRALVHRLSPKRIGSTVDHLISLGRDKNQDNSFQIVAIKLSDLAPLLNPDQLERVLSTMVDLGTADDQPQLHRAAKNAVGLVPYLLPEQIERLIKTLLLPMWEQGDSWFVHSWAQSDSYFTPAHYNILLVSVLDKINSEDAEVSAQGFKILRFIAPNLSAQHHQFVFEAVLQLYLKYPEITAHTFALAILVHLCPLKHHELCAKILLDHAQGSVISDGDENRMFAVQALAKLAPHCSEPIRVKLLDQLIADLNTNVRIYAQEDLAMLAPYLDDNPEKAIMALAAPATKNHSGIRGMVFQTLSTLGIQLPREHAVTILNMLIELNIEESIYKCRYVGIKHLSRLAANRGPVLTPKQLKKVFNFLRAFTIDQNLWVRRSIAESIRAFAHLPLTARCCDIGTRTLITLATDREPLIRFKAAISLGLFAAQIPHEYFSQVIEIMINATTDTEFSTLKVEDTDELGDPDDMDSLEIRCVVLKAFLKFIPHLPPTFRESVFNHLIVLYNNSPTIYSEGLVSLAILARQLPEQRKKAFGILTSSMTHEDEFISTYSVSGISKLATALSPDNFNSTINKLVTNIENPNYKVRINSAFELVSLCSLLSLEQKNLLFQKLKTLASTNIIGAGIIEISAIRSPQHLRAWFCTILRESAKSLDNSNEVKICCISSLHNIQNAMETDAQIRIGLISSVIPNNVHDFIIEQTHLNHL